TVQIDAILDEQTMPLNKIMNLQVGQTIMLNASPDSKIEMRCRGVPLLKGRMGRVGSSVAVRIDEAVERTDASRGL
ncbi:MAG TPA: FliM/FliN family flagellar motor switch protein, partial [Rhizomicrobium sp.]